MKTVTRSVLLVLAILLSFVSASAKPNVRGNASAIIVHREQVITYPNYQELVPNTWNNVSFQNSDGFGQFLWSQGDPEKVFLGRGAYHSLGGVTLVSDGLCSIRTLYTDQNGSIDLGTTQFQMAHGYASLPVSSQYNLTSLNGSYLEMQVMCDSPGNIAEAYLYVMSQ